MMSPMNGKSMKTLIPFARLMAVVAPVAAGAVMLAAPFLTGAAQPEALGAAIALGTGFSSNAVIFGSLAGIIVAEQGKKNGITIGFAEFAKAGVPTSLLCLLLAAGWILYLQ